MKGERPVWPLTLWYLKEEISHWHSDKDTDLPGPPVKANCMISCSRRVANNCSVCV